jgi:hypothetical protein
MDKASGQAHAWIEVRVSEIHQEIDYHVASGNNNRECLDDWIIPGCDGLE